MKKCLFSTLCFVTLFSMASSVTAQRPDCPATGPGACFIDISNDGLFGFAVDGEGDTVIIGPLDGDNDFIRQSPNGNGLAVHQIDREADVYFCAGDPFCEGGGFIHSGVGRVSAHVTLDSGFGLSCPSSIHVNGTVAGPSGDLYTLRAVLLLVKSNKTASGCRAVTDEVAITPR